MNAFIAKSTVCMSMEMDGISMDMTRQLSARYNPELPKQLAQIVYLLS